MDGRGWGLALESDHHLLLHQQQQQQRNFLSGSNNLNKMKFQGIEFPVNLNRRSTGNTTTTHEDEHHHHQMDDDEHEDNMNNKKVVGEVDFFSSDHNHHHNNDDKRVNIIRPSPVHHQPLGVKEENSPRDHQHHQPAANVNTGLHLLTANTGSDQSTIDDGASSDAEDKRAKNELAVLQVELERMNAENQKLKSLLSQVSHNYNTLQMHLVALMQQQQQQQQQQLQKGESSQLNEVVQGKAHEEKKHIVPRQFLDLGPSANNETTDEMTSQTLSDEERMLDRSGSPPNNAEVLSRNNNNKEVGPYDHGKGIREDSPDESEAQGWGPNKVPKLNPPINKGNSPIDQAATEATMRKARVSVRARSEAPMISDGCQWRKYGQKMAKGNPCPRAYYRCTMAVGCPVRKQVQRCAEDRTILITTYEGNHNHPLPPAAMAMASTTSAAASMLLSGSMPSADGLMNPNFLARTILPCSSSMATISASAPFPTVTLDLTHSPNPLQFQRPPQVPQPQATHFQVPFPPSNAQIPPNFMASMPQIFGQALLNHNNNNQSKFSGLHSSSSNVGQLQVPGQNPGLADSISAATAAIASDPNFTAALAAAISSIFGGARPGDNGGPNNNHPGNSSGGATTSGNNNNNNNVVNSSSSMQQ